MLIVRSQDQDFTMECNNYCISQLNYKWYIRTNSESQRIILGKYKTKKRCLEILEEMDRAQEKQMSKCNTRVVNEDGNTIKNELTNHYFSIYYMPKK